MANPNPNTEGLALGRGKRPREDNETVCMRMSSQTKEVLEQIAEQYGCMYGGKPWIAGLLRMIASGELLVVPDPSTFDVRSVVKKRLKRNRSS